MDMDMDMDMGMDMDMDMQNARGHLGIIAFEQFHLRRGLTCGFSYDIGYHTRPIYQH
jgi:hypothetical protein